MSLDTISPGTISQGTISPSNWLPFLLFTLSLLFVQGFFAMMEMASVSFNRVRLQYYVSKGNRRGMWLSHLLSHPAQLFGTTLLMANMALLLGSECSRHLYVALGLNPDLSPLTQVALVLVFAELAPLFAARRYAEHVAMLGAPILYFFSIVLRPCSWLLNLLCRIVHWCLGGGGKKGYALSREELQNILEERTEEFQVAVANIFSLKSKRAKDLMQPLVSVQTIPSTCTVGEMQALLLRRYVPCLPITHRAPQNIVAIAYPRDLLRATSEDLVLPHGRSPWFIVENTSILEILRQFRVNNQSLAVVLNTAGLAIGILTLDEIIDEIFGQVDEWPSFEEMAPKIHHVVVDRSFPAETTLAAFNGQFRTHLTYGDAETLGELLTQALGHLPAKGESLHIGPFELTALEVTLLGLKEVGVKAIL